jgi:TPR repeat protein
MTWYGRAAQAGNAEAEFVYGEAFANGSGVPQSDSAARDWLLKAARQGHMLAQYSLGLLYASGGVVADDQQAAYWLEQAAQQGSSQAQSELGLLYAAGRGVDKDLEKAYLWETLAALQGDVNAPYVKQRLESIMGFFALHRARKAVNAWLAQHGQKPVDF